LSDTVAGADAANLYSLLQTCRANSIDPPQNFIALFNGLPHAHTADDYDALPPWRLN
jgi:transposase